MIRNTTPHFRKTLLALAASAALAPHGAWALDLATAPPGTKEPYVTPNVIISVDDSGSMGYRLDSEGSNNVSNTSVPNADGSWPVNAKRINVLKYALIGNNGAGGVFRDTTLLPDGKIRLAWQAMWNNGKASGAGSVNSASMNTNSMRPLEATHRANFVSFVNGLVANNGTPSHKMFSQADAYMRQPLSENSPWASKPGTTGAPYLACRRSYHIIMTDGRWNNTPSTPGQTDNANSLTLPDGTVFGGSTAAARSKTALYRDSYTNTLADWAFNSWAVPPHTTGMTGTMQPTAEYRKAPATETFTNSSGTSATLERYWNPKYNPATWPHMVTYTIGFSAMAYTWKQNYSDAKFNISPPTSMVPFGYDGSFPNLANGTKTWPDMNGGGEAVRALDLWHAALNGRGRFYAVEKGEDLEKAFREIFGQISTETAPDLTSTATSGSNNTRSNVGKFIGAYEPTNAWKGFVTAETVKTDGSIISAAGWEGKNTADRLDAIADLSTRFILSWSDQWIAANNAPKGGVLFKWASDQTYLSTAQKAALGLNTTSPVTTSGQHLLNYVRGDRTQEGSTKLRERKSRQGDIINSVVWYTGAPASNYPLKGYSAYTKAQKDRDPVIYVGGNDGMLHGFSAADGKERIAYVPRGIIGKLKDLASQDYNNKHAYFVDGSPMTGDVDTGSTDTPNWRTVLVGSLGLGGKGYFVLDVTNPSTTSGFINANASQLVQLDRTRGSSETATDCTTLTGTQKTACETAVEEDKDIGHITAQPVLDENNPARTAQITRLNNGRWAAVLGNGYNSTNQRPVLLIQYLDGNKELKRLATTNDQAGTGNAADNGLSAPRLMDFNGDGMPDVAYAGDNLGNMWKFDLTSENEANWNVAFGGQPLFTAAGPTALNGTSRPNAQSITIAPTVRANDRTMTVGSGSSAKTVRVGGVMVSFGTGRNVTKDDPNDVKVQTLYSVLDNTRYKVVSTTMGKRLQVHPGGGTCAPVPADDCVPVPTPLGSGVTNAKLAQRKIDINGDNGVIVEVDELTKDTWSNFNGWYVDFPSVGQRLLKPMEIYDGSNIMVAWPQVPAKGALVESTTESCESTSVDEERQARLLINIMDGKAPSVQLVDANKDGLYNSDDGGVSYSVVSKGSHILIKQGNKMNDIDTKNNKEALALMPEQTLRPSWRQVK